MNYDFSINIATWPPQVRIPGYAPSGVPISILKRALCIEEFLLIFPIQAQWKTHLIPRLFKTSDQSKVCNGNHCDWFESWIRVDWSLWELGTKQKINCPIKIENAKIITCSHGKPWGVELWTYHFYSITQDLPCEQVVAKTIVI